MKKNSVTDAVLYGMVLVLCVLLLIVSADLREGLQSEQTPETETATELQDNTIRQNVPDIQDTESAFDPASVTTELMDGVTETSMPEELIPDTMQNPDGVIPGAQDQAVPEGQPDAENQLNTEEPYDGENNL